jgi:hypothetical protein
MQQALLDTSFTNAVDWLDPMEHCREETPNQDIQDNPLIHHRPFLALR